MSDHSPVSEPMPPALALPDRRDGGWLRRSAWLAAAAVGLVLAYEAWHAGGRLERMATGRLLGWWSSRPALVLTTLPVDRGEMAATLTENGTIESESDALIRCQVEALVGLTGGRGFVPLGPSNNSSGGVVGAPKLSSRAAAMARAGGRPPKGKAVAPSIAGAVGMPTAPAAGANATGIGPPPRPAIRSFSYPVPPYVPIRPRVSAAVAEKQGRVDPSLMMGGRGNGVFAEKPGSTRILAIVDEGTKVRQGDVVCTLDSSRFEMERRSQQIRYLQAKTLVDQARNALEVNEITLREYQEGVYPQDVQLVQQYLASCRIDAERAQRALDWSREVATKGLRTPNQVRADELALQQAEYRLSDAEHMSDRLVRFTSPRLVRTLKAKIESIRADLLAQEAAFQLEGDRLRRLDAAIAHCTIRAPGDGVIVYYNPPNMWGRQDAQIREGSTVREGQVLMQLPDPKLMRVRARINESKVAQVQPGQKATITVDAFPDRLLRGTVTEITPIPSTVGGPFTDVKIYYAVVRIDSEVDAGLRPGLSAEVTFEVDTPREVTRVPLTALRWVDNRPFAAVARRRPGADTVDHPSRPGAAPASTSTSEGDTDGPAWAWRPLALGRSDPEYAEVVSGLEPGDRVIAQPDQLPAPRPPRHPGLDSDAEPDRSLAAG